MEPRELTPLVLNPPLNAIRITDQYGLYKLRDYLARVTETGLDIETNLSKDFYYRKVRTIQFGDSNEQYVIDLLAFEPNLYDTQGHYGKNLTPGLQQVIDVIAPVLCGRDVLKIGANLGFEYSAFYWAFGLRTQHFWDVSITERVLYAGAHSLKDYPFYSLEEMFGRYFGMELDKTLQTSFNLTDPLTDEQITYAALDTRLPIGIKRKQQLLLQGKYLPNLDQAIMGDNLERVAQIENDCIGAFQDMHIHGERLDTVKWMERVTAKKEELRIIYEKLDAIFLPLVGSKRDTISEEELTAADSLWRGFREISPKEIVMKEQKRLAKKDKQPEIAEACQVEMDRLEAERREKWFFHKAEFIKLRQKAASIRDLAEDCAGEALINYESGAQLLEQLNKMPEIRKLQGWSRKNNDYKKLEDLEDDTLVEMDHIPVIKLIRQKVKLTKELGTYGESWCKEWVTGPCKEEGWLHPGDHRLHCVFNQYEAETGRSASERPNAQNLPKDKLVRACFIVDPPDDIAPEGWAMVTADMSGAELRILAELSQEPVWVEAYQKGQDVHCICCELFEPEEWKAKALPGCAYYESEVTKLKCKCPEHNKARDDMKPTNFGLPYGIGPGGLAAQTGKPKAHCAANMKKHAKAFPIIWRYLEKSGDDARENGKAFDMFGRRRIFPAPEWERARKKACEDNEEDLRFPEEEYARNLTNFHAINGRKPTPEERWKLKHRLPTDKEISYAFQALHGNIERQGKNHCIQATNASIIKISMAKLWHILPNYHAKLIKMVHDELLITCPYRFAKDVEAAIHKAFLEAGAEVLKSIDMLTESHIGTFWKK
jgi:DNA polymerase I-like protein with 3'-5' exonuclease and polymerase domains